MWTRSVDKAESDRARREQGGSAHGLRSEENRETET